MHTHASHISHTTRRRFGLQLAALSLAIAAGLPAFAADNERDATLSEGHVFTSSNAIGGNELLVYSVGSTGAPTLFARVATQGQGTGAGLGSQGAVTLSGDGRHAFVVNAASHTVSTFTLRAGGVTLASVIDSGGLQPISVTESDGIVYVLNAGGAGNVAGFRNVGGVLQPLPNGVRSLSAVTGTNPAQVGFGVGGEVLVVTEKGTNRITSFPVRRDGVLGHAVITTSSGATPFGFAFDARDHLIVSEAVASAASSYRFDDRLPAVPVLVSPSVANTQAAACWVAVTPNGRYAYTANAGTSTLSAYRIERSGRLLLSSAVAASTGANAGATDIAVAPSGRRLFALAPRSLQIVSFRVDGDGALTAVGAIGGLPNGGAGLAVN